MPLQDPFPVSRGIPLALIAIALFVSACVFSCIPSLVAVHYISAGKAAYQRDVEQHTASISSGNRKSRAMDSSRCDSCVLTPSFVECALKYAVDVQNESEKCFYEIYLKHTHTATPKSR